MTPTQRPVLTMSKLPKPRNLLWEGVANCSRPGVGQHSNLLASPQIYIRPSEVWWHDERSEKRDATEGDLMFSTIL